jgi:hypothetical protein
VLIAIQWARTHTLKFGTGGTHVKRAIPENGPDELKAMASDEKSNIKPANGNERQFSEQSIQPRSDLRNLYLRNAVLAS